MTDGRLKGRVKGLFGGTSPENEMMDQMPQDISDSEAERQALQVLVLARRTAEEHVANAQQQADKIRFDARGQAETIVRDAQGHAEGVRREAGKILSDARAKGEEMAREAKAGADGVRREADKTLADARAKAEQVSQNAQANAEGIKRDADKTLADAQARATDIVKEAQASADELDREAHGRYQEVVGSLEAKRSTLTQQIEALQQFEHDYRARLASFMQSQLRALGFEVQPLTMKAEIEQPPSFNGSNDRAQPVSGLAAFGAAADPASAPISAPPAQSGPALTGSTAEYPLPSRVPPRRLDGDEVFAEDSAE